LERREASEGMCRGDEACGSAMCGSAMCGAARDGVPERGARTPGVSSRAGGATATLADLPLEMQSLVMAKLGSPTDVVATQLACRSLMEAGESGGVWESLLEAERQKLGGLLSTDGAHPCAPADPKVLLRVERRWFKGRAVSREVSLPDAVTPSRIFVTARGALVASEADMGLYEVSLGAAGVVRGGALVAPPRDRPRVTCCSLNQKVACFGLEGGTMVVYDVEAALDALHVGDSPAPLDTFSLPGSTITSVDVASPRGAEADTSVLSVAAGTAEGDVYVFELELDRPMGAPPQRMRETTFSVDASVCFVKLRKTMEGKSLVATGTTGGFVYMHDCGTGAEMNSFIGCCSCPVQRISVSGDGRTVFASFSHVSKGNGHAPQVLAWDVASGERCAMLRVGLGGSTHSSAITAHAADDNKICVASEDHVAVFPLSTDYVTGVAKQLYCLPLSDAQLQLDSKENLSSADSNSYARNLLSRTASASHSASWSNKAARSSGAGVKATSLHCGAQVLAVTVAPDVAKKRPGCIRLFGFDH